MRTIFSGFNTIIGFASALAVLASCSRELEVDICTGQVPIAFGSDLQTETKGTRAASAVGLEELADSFIVAGYKNNTIGGWQDVMNRYKVCYVSGDGSSVTNTSGWEYVGQGPDQVTKYWDYSALDYRFMGYVPKSATGKIDYSGSISLRASGVVLTLSGVPRIEISQGGAMTTPDGVTVTEQDFPLFSRLWHGTAPRNEPVRMEFMKPYAKVCVYVMRADDVEATAWTGITLTKAGDQFPEVGTISVLYPIAGDAESVSSSGMTSAELTFNDIAAGEIASPNVPYPLYPQYLLLPNPDGGSRYDFVCAGNKGIVDGALAKLQPGYCYTYIFKITKPTETKSAVTDDGGNGRYEVVLSDVLQQPL